MTRITILDGPMGSELALEGEVWSASALDVAPHTISEIHANYMHAGADLHRTNTFRTQPRLFPDRYEELVAKAVELARAEGRKIAGSMAPIFDCYRPDLAPPEDVARPLHRAMAEALAKHVDLLICETFPSPNEARMAVEEAARTGRETWAALTAGPNGDLLTPEAMEAAARDCVRAGARAVLVCCTGTMLTAAYVDRLARLDIPLGAYANGYGVSPSDYANEAAKWIASGASIVGSCCGTNSAHIAALARLIKS